MTGFLTFGGVSTADYGISVDTSQSFATPQRRVETTGILGRSGEYILYDPGTFDNVVISYPCFIQTNFASRFPDFMAHIHALHGLQVLRDSAHADRYRDAYFMQAVTPQTGVYNKAGVFTLQFSCGVWRLDSGLTVQTFTSNGTITNPTAMIAKPTIYVEGTGDVTINGKTIGITVTETTVNTELMEEDHPITGDYPDLAPGSNTVTLGSGITKVTITPNWWTI